MQIVNIGVKDPQLQRVVYMIGHLALISKMYQIKLYHRLHISLIALFSLVFLLIRQPIVFYNFILFKIYLLLRLIYILINLISIKYGQLDFLSLCLSLLSLLAKFMLIQSTVQNVMLCLQCYQIYQLYSVYVAT